MTKKPSTWVRQNRRRGVIHDSPSSIMVKNRLLGEPHSGVRGKKPSRRELAEETLLSEMYTDFDLGEKK